MLSLVSCVTFKNFQSAEFFFLYDLLWFLIRGGGGGCLASHGRCLAYCGAKMCWSDYAPPPYLTNNILCVLTLCMMLINMLFLKLLYLIYCIKYFDSS